jgi:pro-kumamolisin-like protein
MASPSEGHKVPEGYHQLSGSERPRSSGSRYHGPLDLNDQVSATLVLRRKPDAPSLPDHQHWDNTSLAQRQFLSPQQYAESYGASQADIDAVIAFVSSHGLKVLDSHAGRRTVAISGGAAQINAAFGIQLNRYETPRPEYRSRAHSMSAKESALNAAAQMHMHHGYDGPVHIPDALAGIVIAVIGLDNRAVGGPGGSSGDPAGAKSLAVATVAGLYNFPNSGAADQVIGVIAPSDPVGTSSQRLSGYLANDINSNYFPNISNAAYRTAPASLNDINLTVGTNTYSNSTATVQAITSLTLGSTATGFAMEVTQDISTAATIAQGAAINVYFTEITEQGLLVCLNRILLPEGESQPTVVTCSFNFWGSDETGQIGDVSDSGSAAHQMSALFQALALVGVGVFIISQDRGSNDGDTDGNAHVCYPGSDPWVTSVGGTVIGTVNPGPPVSFAEVVWSNAGSTNPVGNFGGASGGGPSQNFPVPSYQSNAGITSVTDSDGNATNNKRCIPDVAAMVSYSGSGANDWFFINGLKYNFTGTSCACPLLAGLYAVLRSAFGVPLGFFNPTIYQIGGSVCNDITSGNNDPADSSGAPFYNAAAGWDPCTGWGSIDGTKLLNGIAGLMYNQTFYFQVEKNTYGLDEVTAAKSPANAPANSAFYSPAFWLVLEGFTPTAAQGIAPPSVTGAFSALGGVTISVGAAQPEIASQPNTPQRILYPCTIDFASSTMQTVGGGGIFPAPGASAFSLPLTALITIGGQLLGAATVFELVAGADPYFSNFNAAGSNAFYLSEDLRVFTVTPGINNAPILGIPLLPADNTKYDSAAAYSYIQALLAALTINNFDATGADVFTSFPDQSSALIGDSSVTPSSVDPAHPTGTRFSNYNFAIARVRLDGPANSSSIKNVRVFFRMFATQTSDTDYLIDWTYPSNMVGGLPVSPLLGIGNPPVTIPFFATGNYEGNSDHPINVDYSANSANNAPVHIGPSGKAWAYFGCYLNVYPTNNTINGNSVQSMLPGSHHCIVAQIAFDDAPIVNSNGTTENPSNSDKLSQRNLDITFSDNPGPASAHRIPQTFDTRRSAAISSAAGDLTDYPDELMIDWGNTPVGAIAHVYWPQVDASATLALAKKLYSTHQLSAADPNTIRCKVPHGYTYVPVPPGTGENYAGLFTVDLPPGVVAGQVFTITVRRIATRRAAIIGARAPSRLGGGTGGGTEASAAALAGTSVDASIVIGKKMVNWRYVTGSFAIRIPVTTAKFMLPLEEDTLAIMKWRLTQMLPTNRWYPVLVRYISYLSGRVDGLGGNSVSILPNPYGVPPSQTAHPHGHDREFTGKVMSVYYDRFGDFSGFLLLTEEGHEHSFQAREREIEALVRTAWAQRMVISVFAHHHELRWPVSIALRRAPRPLLEP